MNLYSQRIIIIFDYPVSRIFQIWLRLQPRSRISPSFSISKRAKKERGRGEDENRVCINGGRKLGSFLSVHLLVSMEFLRVCCHRNGCAYPGSSDSNHPPPPLPPKYQPTKGEIHRRAPCASFSRSSFSISRTNHGDLLDDAVRHGRDDVSKNTGVGARCPFQRNLWLFLARLDQALLWSRVYCSLWFR